MQRTLRNCRGCLQADAYGGFDALYRGRIAEVGCRSHARRKVFEIAHAAPKNTRTTAHRVLNRIGRRPRIETGVADN